MIRDAARVEQGVREVVAMQDVACRRLDVRIVIVVIMEVRRQDSFRRRPRFQRSARIALSAHTPNHEGAIVKRQSKRVIAKHVIGRDFEVYLAAHKRQVERE